LIEAKNFAEVANNLKERLKSALYQCGDRRGAPNLMR
jgi:hypothetical protein